MQERRQEMNKLILIEGQKVEIDKIYLNDEVGIMNCATKYAIVMNDYDGSDEEELIQVQYETGTIDWVPRDVIVFAQ